MTLLCRLVDQALDSGVNVAVCSTSNEKAVMLRYHFLLVFLDLFIRVELSINSLGIAMSIYTTENSSVFSDILTFYCTSCISSWFTSFAIHRYIHQNAN
jgi:hypothetical protein